MFNNGYSYNLGLAFAEVARRFGNKAAIRRDVECEITFSELDELSRRIAGWMISHGVKSGDLVAVFHDKSVIPYAIMLACLKCGIVYTNVDTTSPATRIQRIVDTAAPRMIFYGCQYAATVAELRQVAEKSVDVCNYCDQSFAENVAKSEPLIDLSMPSGNCPAYLMFTSGSTGFPKGAVISHQNILNFISWGREAVGVNETDVFTNINPMHFDNSVFDFYLSLFSGATLVPVDTELTKNPRHMVKHIEKMKCSIWFSVPSMLVYVLRMRALEKGDIPSLTKVVFGGEGFPKNYLRSLHELLSSRVELINVYGPTECTCICSIYRVGEADLKGTELLPLGPMASNFYGLVVDEQLRVLPGDEVGELLIGGSNVGLGYYREQDKTAAAFIQNPTHDRYRDIMYRSGDMVRWDSEKKTYWFAGRKDNQIKRMGYRIELEEIEAALSSLGGVDEVACVKREGERGVEIVACLSSGNNEEELLEKLRNLIPGYMIPNEFRFYDHLPKNQNGKIDRVALKLEVAG